MIGNLTKIEQDNAKENSKAAEQAQKDADRNAKDAERAAQEEKRRQREIHDETVKLRDDAAVAGLKGIDRLMAEEQKEVDQVKKYAAEKKATAGEQEQWIASVHEKYAKEIATEQEKEWERQSKKQEEALKKDEAAFQKHADLIAKLQEKTALDGVPPWQRASERIILDEQEKVRKLNVLDKDYALERELIAQDANEKLAAEQQKLYEKQQHMAQQYGSQLEQVFNDITSGNIGKRILQSFERFFFNIVGQWIVAMEGMKKVSAGSGSGGGLLGSLLGSVFGGGSGGIAGLAAGGLGTPPFVGDFGAPNVAGSLMALGGTGSGINGPGDVFAGTPLAGYGSTAIGSGTLSAGAGTATVARQQASLGGVLSSLFSKGGLSQVLLPGALGLAGSALSGTTGAALTTLGIGSLLAGHGGAFLSGLAPIAAPIAAGLFGYGIGSQYGPVAGTLAGAGSGAAIGAASGLLFGATLAPVTFGLSILVGALAGLFGGLFGGGPSKHSLADKYIQANVVPAINAEVASFMGFGVDYATALSDLEKLKTDSHTQMTQQFGKDASNDEWNKFVIPAISDAEKAIGGYQSDRNQRSSINFGLPQFATGGMFVGAGPGLAILHPGEKVMTSRATSAFGADLDAMESSARSGGRASTVGGSSPTNIYINAIDVASFRQFLNSGSGEAAQEIGEAVKKHFVPRYSGFGRG